MDLKGSILLLIGKREGVGKLYSLILKEIVSTKTKAKSKKWSFLEPNSGEVETFEWDSNLGVIRTECKRLTGNEMKNGYKLRD